MSLRTMKFPPLKEGELEERVQHYDSLIPVVYDTFPEGFKLYPSNWAKTREELAREPVKATIHGQEKLIRPITHMDLEFLSNTLVRQTKQRQADLVKDYPCGLKCPGCFSQEKVYGDSDRLMSWQEIMSVVDGARAIGLQDTKFLGPGELLQNPDLFDILDAFEERKLPLSIFTKGAELGSDELARQNYGHLGINTAKELANRLAKYDTVRILLGFNSFIPDRQDKMVGSLNRTNDYKITNGLFVNRGVADYTTKRDQALVNLVEAGFNDPKKGQRLSLIATPIGLDQIDEVPDMYMWAAKRNMPMIIAPTMESGPKSLGLMKHNNRIDSEHQKLIDMYIAVYSRAIEEGVLTLEHIHEEGISSYMGTAPCHQVANGLFIRLNGQVQMCPGKSDASAVYGNAHDNTIAEIWHDSPHYQMGQQANNWCPAKVNGMPSWIQGVVMKKLEEKYA